MQRVEADLASAARLTDGTPPGERAPYRPSPAGLWIHAISVNPGESLVDVGVYCRTRSQGWTALGALPADQRLLWSKAHYPCEIVAQSQGLFGTVLLESAPTHTHQDLPEVTIQLQPCGSISGYITPENLARIPGLAGSEVYYLATEVDRMPRTRQELLALPQVLGGLIELGDGQERFVIPGLNPSKSYRLWAASVSKSTAGDKRAWPGGREVELKLLDVLGFCAELLYDGQPLAQTCDLQSPLPLGVNTPPEAGPINGLNPPLRWTTWSPDYPNSRCQSPVSSMILAPISAGLTPRGSLGGGRGDLQFQGEFVPYSPINASGHTEKVQVELLQAPVPTGGLHLRFCCNPISAPLTDSERSLGTLQLYPINDAGHYRRFWLTAADYPEFHHDCIPAGRYQILFESSDTQQHNVEDPLPIVVIEPQVVSEISLELPAWGSLEIQVEFASQGLDQRGPAVGLIEAETVTRLAADPRVPTDDLVSPDLQVPAGRTHMHFIPSGIWYVDPIEPSNPRLDRLEAIKVLRGQTTLLRLTVD
jgi:hypothetical protein